MSTSDETAALSVAEQVRQVLVMYVEADEVDDALLALTQKGLLRADDAEDVAVMTRNPWGTS